jgi:hypothetical protein
VPPLTQVELNAAAFDVLRTLLEGGVTSPSQAVQLQALALIPGTKVVTDARNATGQPGIAVAITSPDPAQTGFLKEEIIFDSRTYQDIGGVLVQPGLAVHDPLACTMSRALSVPRSPTSAHLSQVFRRRIVEALAPHLQAESYNTPRYVIGCLRRASVDFVTPRRPNASARSGDALT